MVSERVLKEVLSGVLSGVWRAGLVEGLIEGLVEGLVEGLLPSSWPMTGREFRTRAQRGSDFCATVESRHGEEGFPTIRTLQMDMCDQRDYLPQ